jgi:hypothetical protein
MKKEPLHSDLKPWNVFISSARYAINVEILKRIRDAQGDEDFAKLTYAELRRTIKRMEAVRENKKQRGVLGRLASVSDGLIARRPKGFFIDLLLPTDRADDALWNLQGSYDEKWLPKYGALRAKLIFLAQSLGFVIRFYVDWALKRLKLLDLVRRSWK